MTHRPAARDQILAAVAQRGGVHKSELCRLTGRGWGTVGHHVGLLAREGRVATEAHGRRLWVFDPAVPAERRRWLVHATHPRRMAVLQAIAQGPVTVRAIAAQVGLSPKAVRTHLRHLRDVGAVEELAGGRYAASAAALRTLPTISQRALGFAADSLGMLRTAESLALQLAQGAVVAIGDDGRIAFANPAALDLLGWRTNLIGKPLSALVPERLQERHHDAYGAFVTSREPSSTYPKVQPARGEDGREREVLVHVAGFWRPDGSMFLCSAMAPAGQSPPSLEPLEIELWRHGYRKFTP